MASPLALVPEKANEQHYEVPPKFFELVLGSNLKYSSGFWGDGIKTLDQSEELMLSLTCERAELENGQSILELGCGWGSLTCFMGKIFPDSKIVAVSNSNDQKIFIQHKCSELELNIIASGSNGEYSYNTYFIDVNKPDDLSSLVDDLQKTFSGIGVTFIDQNQMPSI